MIGSVVSHYKILSKLGEGGMGVVYKAEDTRLKRAVALKFLPPEATADPPAKERFIREAQAASALQHNAICTIHDIDESSDGQMFIVMDFYEGETLKEKIERGPLPLQEVLALGAQIADGLGAAHAVGMIHRDIKPANIFVTKRGEVRILDFGVARLAGRTRLTRDGGSPGTLAYMSPEQVRGEEVDQRTDLWSSGVVLHEMLTGKLPFRGEFEQALGFSILNEAAPPVTSLRAGLPMDLELVLKKALSKDRAERYQHADDLGADLRRLIHESSTGDRPPITSPATGRFTVPRRRIVAYGGVIVGLLIIGAYFLNRLFFGGSAHGEPFPIAVISFENQTGDPRYDHLSKAIPNLLITSLEQCADLRVTTWDRLRDLARQTGTENPDHVGVDQAFALCLAGGVRGLVIGSFTKAGEEFATDVKVLDVGSRNIMMSTRSQGEGEASILRTQIDGLSDEIQRKILRASQGATRSHKPISEFTTNSLEAYNYYLLGREKYDNQDMFDAVKLLTLATDRDSGFAIAYLYLARANSNLSRLNARSEACARAYMLSPKASEKERMYIEAGYALMIQRDRAKQTAVLEAMRKRFPDEKEVRYELGLAYLLGGHQPRSAVELEEAIRLDPDYGAAINQLAYICVDQQNYARARELLSRYRSIAPEEPNPYDSWGDLYVKCGDLDSAVIMYREAMKRKADFFASSGKIAMISALRENYDEAESQFREMWQRSQMPGALAFLGFMKEIVGEPLEARESSGRAADIWKSQGAVAFSTFDQLAAAWVALGAQQRDAVTRGIGSAERRIPLMAPNDQAAWRVMCGVGLAERDISAGYLDSARARLDRLADALATLDGWTRSLMEYELGLSRGQILLADGRTDSAIAIGKSLRIPTNPQLYGPRIATLNLSVLYASRTRLISRAFLAKGDTVAAVHELEQLVRTYPQRPDMRFVNPILHYDLADLLERIGEKEKAKAQYEKFVRILSASKGYILQIRHARERLQELDKTSTAKTAARGSP